MFSCSCIYAHCLHAWCSKKPEEDIRSPGTGDTHSCVLRVSFGDQTHVIFKNGKLSSFTSGLSLQPQMQGFKKIIVWCCGEETLYSGPATTTLVAVPSLPLCPQVPRRAVGGHVLCSRVVYIPLLGSGECRQPWKHACFPPSLCS